MAHHNSRDCGAWPCKPGPPAGHHPAPAAVEHDEDDQTTSEARAEVQVPLRREDGSA